MNKSFEIFPWNENFVGGIPEIDEQHKRLVHLVNVLASGLAYKTDTLELNNIFSELADYAVYHFQTEENIWQQFFAGDAWEAAHKQTHESFVSDVLRLKNEESGKPLHDALEDILSFLTHWLAFHILDSDKRMAKIVLAVQSGMSLEQAKQHAHHEMSGATEVLVRTVLSMYDTLANRTLQLMKETIERQKTEQKADVLVQRNQLLMQSSPEGIHILNEQGNIIEANDAFCRHLGYTPTEILQLSVFDFEAKMAPEEIRTGIKKLINGHAQFESVHRRKDGTLVDVEVIVSGVDNNGLKCLFALSRDITERKQAEEMLRQQKQLSDDIINSLPGIFYMLDMQGKFIRMNPQFIKVTGYSRKELERMTALDLFEGEDKNLIANKMQEVFETGDSAIEAEMIIKSGRKIPYYFTGHRTSIDGQPYLVGLGTDITKRRELEQELTRQARMDSLTGLANRRYFIELAQQELLRAKRFETLPSVLMLDLDKFKEINDTYGHQVGDDVLRKVSDICRKSLREVDIVGRLGGEEFAIMLPESDTRQAMEVAERLRQDIANASILLAQGGKINITVSIGISTLTGADTTVDMLLNLADKGLYVAKRAGRNRVCQSNQ